MQKRCERNRNRSKRRAIYCPIHGCYLHSVSKKYPLYASTAEQLKLRGIGKKDSRILIATNTAVSLAGEWLEQFWCDRCQQRRWYHVRKHVNQNAGNLPAVYELSVPSSKLWRQATGVIDPEGNPSVSEFTRNHARRAGYQSNWN